MARASAMSSTCSSPEGAARATVVFVHGGYWQALDRSSFSHLARGLNAHGIAVAMPGYDLCPKVRVGDIVDQIRAACLALRERGPSW
jgi:arylformamidase